MFRPLFFLDEVPSFPMSSVRKQSGWQNCRALLTRMGQCALLAAVLSCSGCAWFKTKEPTESPDINLREDPKEARVRPKREGGSHNYGGWSSEAQSIERNLGL